MNDSRPRFRAFFARHRRILPLLLVLALGGLLLWLTFAWQPQAAPGSGATQGVRLPDGGDFSLESADGPVALADYRGKVVILYFGYTFCPDVCPTSLSTLAAALSALTPGELRKVAGFMVSVDPERDTKAVLKAYAPFFHPSLTGITGTPEQVAKVAAQYGVRYMKQKPDADGQYSVDHSSFTYIIAADGKLAATLPHGSPPSAIVDTVRSLLSQTR